MVIVYILVQVLFLNQGDGKMLKERKKERKPISVPEGRL